MESITLSWYIKTIRNHSINYRTSYQNVLGDLFDSIFFDRKETYFVESTASSRIMNGEYDVPRKVREKYNGESDENKKNISDQFIKKMINSSSMDSLIHKVKEKVSVSEISKQTKNMILDNNDAFQILSIVLSIAIITPNRTVLNKNLYNDNNGSIDLISGDLIAIGFNKKLTAFKKIVVIPVDDRFTMFFQNKEGDDIISKDTVHGKWLLRLNKLGINMPKIKYIKTEQDIKIGKCEVNKTEFYLLPISSIKERNKAESGIERIKIALNALASEYNISGQGIPIYVPLIGTGRSRANVSLKESVSFIKNAFINNSNVFFGNVKIVAYQKCINELENNNVL